MRAPSLWLPYLAGVLHGDGYCSRLGIGLRCADHDFAQAFADALNIGFGLSKAPHLYRGYFNVRVSNRSGRFSAIRGHDPSTPEECAAWLRGMFDSEGNAQALPVKHCSEGYYRRVAFYNTDDATISKTVGYLRSLGISTRVHSVKPSAGHLGTRPVYEIAVRCGLHNFTAFASLIGSNIARKQSALQAIVASYDGLRERLQNAQRRGAATRTKRTLEQTLPTVIDGIRVLIAAGLSPTLRQCATQIPGYWALLGKHFTHRELLAMAREAPCAA